MEWIWIWVSVIALSLVVEFATLEMVSIWTALGGICALILATLEVSVEIQLIVFFVVTIVTLLSLRKFAVKYLLKNTANSGFNSLVGSTHRLLTEITEKTFGTVKINGVVWSAITIDGSELPADTLVEIIEIKGNKLIVKMKEK